MDFIMEDDLIFKIGEAIMIETDEVEDIEYASENTIIIFIEGGKKYALELAEIKG